MVDICLYFQVHQPYRIAPYTFFDIDQNDVYFDDAKNRLVLEKVARNCYIPANQLFLDLIEKFPGQVKLTFSLSGTVLEQLELWSPEALQSFVKLGASPQVELLGETYFHSLASVFDEEEFYYQVRLHQAAMEDFFGKRPTVFRNTELIYSDKIEELLAPLGYETVLTEGWGPYLGENSHSEVFYAKEKKLKILVKNYKLSDDIAFRFGLKDKNGELFTASTFLKNCKEAVGDTGYVGIFMDYETFGEHQSAEKGIFQFIKEMVSEVANATDFQFVLPSTLAKQEPKAVYSVPNWLSWADVDRDLSAWNGNAMQREALEWIFSLGEKAKQSPWEKEWRKLLTSDHFYYMSTKGFGDGAVHHYFNAFRSPYDAHIYYMNILTDLERKLKV